MPRDAAVSDASWVEERIDELLRAEYDDRELAFAHVVLRALFDLDEDEAYEACEVGMVGDGGPDAYWHDEEGRRVHLVVASYRRGGRGRFGPAIAGELDAAYAYVDSPKCRQRRDKLGAVARELERLRRADPDYPVELWAVCFGTVPRNARDAVARVAGEVKGEAIGTRALGVRELLERVAEQRSRDAPAMVDEVRLTLHDHFLHRQPGQPRAIVADIDALELARLEKRYGYRLFQTNVRYLLRGRQRINDGISDTLRRAGDREHFWYYNNGIAVLCDRFWFDRENGQTSVVAENFQIVNGCQTTATLARTIEALESADPPVRILARIIEGRGDSDLRDKLPLYNNRQNAVKDRDLQSNDEIQGRLQRDFAALDPPWFYARKRGEWEAKLSNRQVTRFRDRIVENDVSAQAFYALFHDPGAARARKRSLFQSKRENGLYEDVFNTDTTAEALLFSYLLARYVSRQVARYRREIRGLRRGQGSAADQKKLDREWLKFGEQYIIGTIGWYLRWHGPVTRSLLRRLALERFDDFVMVAYERAVRDLNVIFRRFTLSQPVNDDGVRDRIDYANFVKGNWPEVVAFLDNEYDIRGEGPLDGVL